MSVIPHWNRLLVVAVVAVLGTATLNTAQADLILPGTVLDFQDGTIGSDPVNSADLTWDGYIQGSKTRVGVGPVDPANLTLFSNPNGSSSSTGKRANFSAAMQAAVPTDGTIDFRFYLNNLVSQPSVFRVMGNVLSGVVNNSDTLLGLRADVGGNFRFISNGTAFTTRPVVLNEWIDVSIDYSLDNSTDNLTVTLNSASIANESFTFTKDLTGLMTNGFLVFNPGSAAGDNVFHVDDINWATAVAAVPEPSSFAFFSLVAMLATGYRRKKSV